MLAFIRFSFPAPAPVPARVERYRGVVSGWQPIGSRASATEARALARLLSRIDPCATVRVR